MQATLFVRQQIAAPFAAFASKQKTKRALQTHRLALAEGLDLPMTTDLIHQSIGQTIYNPAAIALSAAE